MLRFFGTGTTEPGDSGAPVLMLKDGRLHLLGFHFFEGGRVDGRPDDRTFSEAAAAYLVLDRLGATLGH